MLAPADCAFERTAAQVTAKNRRPQVPATLADATLVDGPTCAAVGAASTSWWLEEVRAGRAPKPAIQRPRFTRWRASDVAAFWRDLAERGADDGGAVERMAARAKKASIKAREPAAVAKAQATRKARIAAREGVLT